MRPRGILIAAVLLGLATSALVYTYVSRLSGPPAEEKRVNVVVASSELQPRSVVRSGMVRIAQVPLSTVHPDAVISMAEVEGRIVKDAILPGEQVLRSRLYGELERPGLTFAIPPGKRAVSVAVNEVIGVAGFVHPGDDVDVLATFDKDFSGVDMTTTVLQGVKVLAISQETRTNSEQAKLSTTVTLAVTLEEAERLTLAEEKGSLRLALRPAQFADEIRVSGATVKEVLGQGNGANAVASAPRPATNPAPSAANSTPPPARVSPPPPAPKPPEPVEVEVIRGTRREISVVD